MTARKLTESDKSDILELYRQTGETTSTLADRYGVSNSTISRLLKSTLPEDEYEALIATKRAARTYFPEVTQTLLFEQAEPEVVAEPVVEEPVVEEIEPIPETVIPAPILKRSRRRSSISSDERPGKKSSFPGTLEVEAVPASDRVQIDFDEALVNELEPRSKISKPQPFEIAASGSSLLEEDSGAQASTIAQMLGEDLLDESEDLADLDDADLDDDDEDLDDDELDGETPVVTRPVPAETLVRVLPLSEANLPRTCYLVIDRASELIARPLKDFGDLGQIPSQEFQQKTLPVFDNHRVARRFSTKRDRVIKIPDSRLLQKAGSQLQAKGITRLLVDGRVYSLSPTQP